jgi:hypothetical protein
VHEPRQAPTHYITPYDATIADTDRRIFAGMLSAVDEGMHNVTAALKAAGMYEDTLFVVTTDNGGPTTECSTTGQSNWPFRGSKCSIWEGGTRGAAFMFWAGLPKGAQGLRYAGLVHAADWLPTIVSAVAAEPLKPGDTLPLDGIDMWRVLNQNMTSPRTFIYYGTNQGGHGPAVRDTAGFKLILAPDGGGKGEWSPEQLPNKSSVSVSVEGSQTIYPLGTAAWCVGGLLGCHGTICLQNNTCYPGGDLKPMANISGPTQCCEICAKNSACVAFTYRGSNPATHRCLLKSSIGAPSSSRCTSGYKQGHAPAPPSPAPAPSPPPAKMVFYNVIRFVCCVWSVNTTCVECQHDVCGVPTRPLGVCLCNNELTHLFFLQRSWRENPSFHHRPNERSHHREAAEDSG